MAMDGQTELEQVLSKQAPDEFKLIELDFQTKYSMILEEKRQLLVGLYQRLLNGNAPRTTKNEPQRHPNRDITHRNKDIVNNNKANQSECNQLMKRGAVVAIECCDSQGSYSGAGAACTLISISMLNVLASNYLKIKPRQSKLLYTELDQDGPGWDRGIKRAIEDYATWYRVHGNPKNIYPYYDELEKMGLLKKYKGEIVEQFGGFSSYKAIKEILLQAVELSYKHKCAYGGIYTNNESTSAFVSTYLEDKAMGRVWVFDSHGRIHSGRSMFVLFSDVDNACKFILENLSRGACNPDSMEVEQFIKQQDNPSLAYLETYAFHTVLFKWC